MPQLSDQDDTFLTGVSASGPSGVIASGPSDVNAIGPSGVIASGPSDVIASEPSGVISSGPSGVISSEPSACQTVWQLPRVPGGDLQQGRGTPKKKFGPPSHPPNFFFTAEKKIK